MFLPYQLVIAGFLPSTVAPVFVRCLLLSPPEFFVSPGRMGTDLHQQKGPSCIVEARRPWIRLPANQKIGSCFVPAEKHHITTPSKTNQCPLKSQWVGRCISYWNSPFSGDMLVFGGVPVSPIISREVLNNDSTTRNMKGILVYNVLYHWTMI